MAANAGAVAESGWAPLTSKPGGSEYQNEEYVSKTVVMAPSIESQNS